ncbi:MAG: glutathione S-transferase N-terminal domain-containing protein, partial [Alphaproteobacteria bacterium]|nr:glutathione S-transferase N-terminal domain-containing protein [Alphaproteobacteria bacterium]
MKLYYNNTSPFARKNRILILEKSIFVDVELVKLDPYKGSKSFDQKNPLNKIPVLELENDQFIYDSMVISSYLDEVDGKPLRAYDKENYFRFKTQEALANGMIEAAYNSTMELKRPADHQSTYWLARWEHAIIKGLSSFELIAKGFEVEIDRTQIDLAACLGYLDFRMKKLDWR